MTAIEKLEREVRRLVREERAAFRDWFRRYDQIPIRQSRLHCRALGVEVSEGVLWFWIGTHSDYDKLLDGV